MNEQTKQKTVSLEDLQVAVKEVQNAGGFGNVATCSTQGSTVAKAITLGTIFELVSGAVVVVKFTNAITVDNATLVITHTDLSGTTTTESAKPIYYHGAALPANLVQAGAALLLQYDGTAYNIVGDIEPDISGKADKDTDAVAGNIAKFDANGNPVDSGIKTTSAELLDDYTDISSWATSESHYDLNNLTTTGSYAGDFRSCPYLDNKPSNVGDHRYVIIVRRLSNGSGVYIEQEYHCIVNSFYFIRSKSGSNESWSGWRKVAQGTGFDTNEDTNLNTKGWYRIGSFSLGQMADFCIFNVFSNSRPTPSRFLATSDRKSPAPGNFSLTQIQGLKGVYSAFTKVRLVQSGGIVFVEAYYNTTSSNGVRWKFFLGTSYSVCEAMSDTPAEGDNIVAQADVQNVSSGVMATSEDLAATKSEIIGTATSACDTLGEAEELISAEASRAQAAEALLQDQYQALDQSALVVLDAATWAGMSSWQTRTIYRVQGTTEYYDYMWDGNSAQPTLMATYNNVGDKVQMKDLFLGTLVQKGYTASGLTDNTRRVSTLSVITVPYKGVSVKAKMPSGYCFGIRYGSAADNLSTNSGWKYNGAVVTFPTSASFYRLSFGKNGGSDELTVEEITALLQSRDIEFIYEDDHDIIRDNKETEKYVKAMMRNYFSDSGSNNTFPNIPVFAHMSDMHGDAKRYSQFLDYCDYLGVHAALITGDFAAKEPANYCQYINDIADTHNTMVLPCTGNHDVRGLYTAQEQNERVVGYLMTKHGVTTNPNEQYPTYFYKDFTSQKIRIISLNLHELQRSQPDGCNFTQAQAEWFISALASTPQDYGVLVMYHVLEDAVVKDNDHAEFYQSYSTYTIFQSGLSGKPVSKIIDAFISKTTASITYTSQGTSITVNADFTSVASGVEFIAHVCGHEHIDWIGVVNGTTNRQLILDVTCGIAIYGGLYATLPDIPRGGESVTQDAFNIYGIDRTHKTVKVARVGSNVTPEAKDRKCMIIPYATV